MGLSVRVYKNNQETGKREFLPYELGEQLAGAEANRTTLWGSDIMKNLGLVILPSLKHFDVYAQGDQLEKLEREVHLILNNVELISKHTKMSDVGVRNLSNNILTVIDKAKRIGGGVVIW